MHPLRYRIQLYNNTILRCSDVRVATLPAFALVVTNQHVTMDTVDRVTTQLTELVSSSVSNEMESASKETIMLKSRHVEMSIINIAIKHSASVHPKFRDECKYT